MKSFFKYVFATVVGIIIVSLFLFLISLGIVSALVASQSKTVEIKPNSILYLKLDQEIVDRKPSLPFDIGTLSKTSKLGLNTLLADIKKAEKDDNIKGIHMDLSVVRAGIGTIEEIRNALLDFKESGKFVTVYSEMLSQGGYYLATAADEIYINPVGMMEWVGLRAQSPFFKHALKKLDVEATIIRHGKFKSAGEPFFKDKYSDENRAQLNKVITAYWEHILANIEEQRSIESSKLNEIAEKLLLKDTKSAYQFGMVDSLLYKDQVIDILKEKTGISLDKDLRMVSLSEYTNVPKQKEYKGLAKDKIAVVYASGEIRSGKGDEQTIGSDKFAKAIRKARRDSAVKAIVVRVNSPGGSALASDVIWRELYLAKQVKPVVVSMGDVAASGGYYIACMADSIIAQPTTLTGSIGVFGMHMNMKGLFSKYGITFDVEKTNEYADFLSGLRSASPYELSFWQSMVDSIYTTFVRRVDDGRALSYDEIDAIGQGRIWSGIDALEIGLIDKFGGLNDAIEIAKNMAGLDEKYRIVELPKLEDPFEKIIKELTQNASLRSLERKLGIHGDYINSLRLLYENQGILARMPYDILIY